MRRHRFLLLCGLALASALVACSSGSTRPEPAPLPAVAGGVNVKRVWSTRIGETAAPLQATVVDGQLLLANVQGQLFGLDATTGRESWRLSLGRALTAGVGSDGKRHAVVTVDNELVVVQAARVLWRQRLAAQTLTAPLVAGERVFVQMADRSLLAFDGAGGQRLWQLQRNTDPLVVRQAGVLIPVGNTLLAGNGGRLSALDPLNGQVRWDVLLGSSRGTNEVERLVDLVAGVSRQDQTLCVRAFQTSVGCVDTVRGQVLWSRPSQGHLGLDGDGERLFGTESDSKLQAWNRKDGQLLWALDQYRFRQLTAPRVWGGMLALGDGEGLLHLLDSTQGKTMQRLATDGSAFVQQPLLFRDWLLTINRSGLVTAWRVD